MIKTTTRGRFRRLCVCRIIKLSKLNPFDNLYFKSGVASLQIAGLQNIINRFTFFVSQLCFFLTNFLVVQIISTTFGGNFWILASFFVTN